MAEGSRPAGMDSARQQLHLANERTYLAQVRTGVAIMAFGFVVARFALFLQDLNVTKSRPSTGHDTLIGAATTALGAVVVLLGAIRYIRRRRAIAHGELGTSPLLDLVVAGLLAAGGIGLAVFLLAQGSG
jgi:putative membrane protein